MLWNFDYSGKYGYFRPTMEKSLDQVTREMRKDYEGWSFDIDSAYRNPAYNATLKERGLTTENPSGNSEHIYGFATDVIKPFPTNKKEREKQRKLYNKLLRYSPDFYGMASVQAFFNETSPHIDWPNFP